MLSIITVESSPAPRSVHERASIAADLSTATDAACVERDGGQFIYESCRALYIYKDWEPKGWELAAAVQPPGLSLGRCRLPVLIARFP
jgi:hypothetical protein